MSPEPSAAAPESSPPPIREDPSPGLFRSFLHLVYNTGWWVFLLLYSPGWLTKGLRNPEYGRMARGRLTIDLPPPPVPGGPPRILIHGVSVGEVKAAQSLVRAIREELPRYEVLISTITVTGHAEARRIYPDLRVVSFPLEPFFFARRFFRAVDPVCCVMIELEAWPNFLRTANRHGAPLAVVNGRITMRSFERYRRFKTLLPQFSRFTLMCAQDEEYARRFGVLARDADRILVTGNIKWDSLPTGRVEAGEELRRLLGAEDGRDVVVAGSTHAPEERWITAAWREHFPHTRLVIVPRHPSRVPSIRRGLTEDGSQPQLLSELRTGAGSPDPARPVIVDTIGELERIYGLAQLVFVGGSLVDHGGQNMLEPAAQGVAVVHGPHVQNFAIEARRLEEAGGSRCLAGLEQLGPVCAEILEHDDQRAAMAAAGARTAAGLRGATALTLAAIRERCLDGPREVGEAAEPAVNRGSLQSPRVS